MAEKLIPGIPHATRITLLQQTDVEGQDDGLEDAHSGGTVAGGNTDKTVLEYAMTSDSLTNDIIQKANCKSYLISEPWILGLTLCVTP